MLTREGIAKTLEGVKLTGWGVTIDDECEATELLRLALVGFDAEHAATIDVEIAKLRAENARLREAMPSERVLLMFATAIPHHPLFSQAMREECTDAIMRLSKAKKENVGDR